MIRDRARLVRQSRPRRRPSRSSTSTSSSTGRTGASSSASSSSARMPAMREYGLRMVARLALARADRRPRRRHRRAGRVPADGRVPRVHRRDPTRRHGRLDAGARLVKIGRPARQGGLALAWLMRLTQTFEKRMQQAETEVAREFELARPRVVHREFERVSEDLLRNATRHGLRPGRSSAPSSRVVGREP